MKEKGYVETQFPGQISKIQKSKEKPKSELEQMFSNQKLEEKEPTYFQHIHAINILGHLNAV